MDRRSFLHDLGLGLAAAGVAACAPGKTEDAPGASRALDFNGEMPSHFPGIGLLGFGAMRWPMVKDAQGADVIDQDKVNEMVDFALAHGVNYFDSAPVYLQGQSEAATGLALSRHPRDSYQVATKLSNFRMAPGREYQDGVEMLKRSLANFRTDHIDWYLLHSVGDAEAFDKRFVRTGLIDFVLAQRRSGTIRHLGLSFHGTQEGFDEILALHDKYHWDFVQIQMNYQDWTHSSRDARAESMYTALAAKGIPVVIMEPLRGGALAELPQALAARLKAREPQLSVASWAFRFAGSFPGVMTVLSGMTCMEHLQDNLDTFLHFKPVSDEDKALLEEIAARLDEAPLVKCTGCRYCMPCPYGIDIPGVFKFYNRMVNEGSAVSLTEEQKDFARARRKYLAEYDKAVETVRQADHCISCGKCVKDCPQHIRIPKEMQRIDAYIEALKQA